MIQRLQCRDPFDLHRLLVREDVRVDEAWALFEEKAAHKGLDAARFDERLESRERDYEKRWEREMTEHTGEVPHFEELMRELRRALRARRSVG